MAKNNFSYTVSELQNAIENRVLPIFEVFYQSSEDIMQHSLLLSQMNQEDIDPNYNEFVGAAWMKMAYLQGLRLK